MEYIGYMDDTKRPVYKVVDKKGYSNKGRYVREYGLDRSMLQQNRVNSLTDEQAIDMVEKNYPNKDKFIYVHPDSRYIKKEIDEEPTIVTDEAIDAIKNQSDTNISPEERSLNVGPENRQIEAPMDIKDRMKKDLVDAGIYSDKEIEQLNKMIDEHKIDKVEDQSSLIEKICNHVYKIDAPTMVRGLKNKYSIK
jgi:hypothetical protein